MDDNIIFFTYNSTRKNIVYLDVYSLKKIQEIGAAIREKRLEKKISQMELGFQSGLSKNCISEIELGNKNFKIITLLKILKALDLDINVFTTYKNK